MPAVLLSQNNTTRFWNHKGAQDEWYSPLLFLKAVKQQWMQFVFSEKICFGHFNTHTLLW